MAILGTLEVATDDNLMAGLWNRTLDSIAFMVIMF